MSDDALDNVFSRGGRLPEKPPDETLEYTVERTDFDDGVSLFYEKPSNVEVQAWYGIETKHLVEVEP